MEGRRSALNKDEKKKKKKSQVCLEGVVDGFSDDDLPRTKSLTDEDLDELKGCVDLGFGFSYEEIPELYNTLPALELCYSMSQKFLDETSSKQACSSSDTASSAGSDSPSPGVTNWKISSPGVCRIRFAEPRCHQLEDLKPWCVPDPIRRAPVSPTGRSQALVCAGSDSPSPGVANMWDAS